MRSPAVVSRRVLSSTLGLAASVALLITAACGGAAPASPTDSKGGATTAAPAATAPAGASPATAPQTAPATSGSPAAASKAPSGEPIKIYFQFTFTGPSASTGIFFGEGAKVAVKQINESGGIMGRPIEY